MEYVCLKACDMHCTSKRYHQMWYMIFRFATKTIQFHVHLY